jgi:hypothetical protein
VGAPPRRDLQDICRARQHSQRDNAEDERHLQLSGMVSEIQVNLFAVSNHRILSKRKYKMKLKDWNFDKYLPATNMDIIVAKASKRATLEGKETVFYNGGQEINAERIENFKKRRNSNDVGMASPSAGKTLDTILREL